MKKILFFLAAFFALNAFADVVSIDGRVFQGEVKKVNSTGIHLQVEGRHYKVPFDKIDGVFFESEGVLSDSYARFSGAEPCLAAKMDVTLRGKAFAQFLGGVFFGPLAVIHKFLVNYHPKKDLQVMALSGNRELFDNPAYLHCYAETARTKALVMTGVGWLTWLFLLAN